MIDYQLKDQKALVCGASKGIGKAIATILANSGASLCLLARSEEQLKEVCESLPCAAGQQHIFFACDMSDLGLVQKVADAAIAKMGSFSILINNTGGPKPGPCISAEVADFQQAVAQHLFSAHTLLKALLPGMRERKQGRIINVISTSVKQPIVGLGVSNTVRAAMGNWAKTLASELGPMGITVNNVLPGSTLTERLELFFAAKAELVGKSVAEVKAMALDEVPLRRFAKPEEVAHAVAFLCSEGGGYINGVNVPVDGGRTLSL